MVPDKCFNYFLLSLLLLFGSCKKNGSPERTNNESRLKYMDLRWSKIPPEPSSDKIKFYYDINGRVISIKAHNTLISPSFSYDSIFNFYFEYNGNNNLPHIVKHSYQYPAATTEIHYLKYDGSSRPISDSVRSISSSPPYQDYFLRISRATYTGNQIIFTDSSVGAPFYSYKVTTENENLISWENIPANSSTDEFYKYDSGINPLNRLNIAPIFPIFHFINRPALGYWSAWTFCNKNNMTKIYSDYYSSLGQYNDSVTFANFYDSGERLEKRIFLRKFIGFAQDTIYFIYE